MGQPALARPVQQRLLNQPEQSLLPALAAAWPTKGRGGITQTDGNGSVPDPSGEQAEDMAPSPVASRMLTTTCVPGHRGPPGSSTSNEDLLSPAHPSQEPHTKAASHLTLCHSPTGFVVPAGGTEQDRTLQASSLTPLSAAGSSCSSLSTSSCSEQLQAHRGCAPSGE